MSDGFTMFVCANPLYSPGAVRRRPAHQLVVPGSDRDDHAVRACRSAACTGMAVGHGVWTTSPSTPCTDVLFITNGTCVMAIDVRPPNAVVIAPWIAPGVFPQVLTGLEYEDTPGQDYLWACDGLGTSFIYTTGGVLAGGPFPVLGPPPPPPVTGNVLDRSTCPPGYWVTDGQFLYPSFFANPTIPLNPPAVIGLCFGASASAEPVSDAGTLRQHLQPVPVDHDRRADLRREEHHVHPLERCAESSRDVRRPTRPASPEGSASSGAPGG